MKPKDLFHGLMSASGDPILPIDLVHPIALGKV